MKVKNIAFSGFAAMIFAGLCGAADAASVNLASKSYVDTQLAGKANLIDLEALETTVGQKATQESLNTVATQVNQNTLDIADLKAAGYLTETDLNNLKTTLQAAIDDKQAKGDYADAAELETLKTTVETLQSGTVDKTVVENLQTTVNTISADYAKKSELTSAEERLQAAIDAIKIPDVSNLVTNTQLTELRTALETEIAKKQDSGDYATADALTAISTELGTLKNNVYTKDVIDQKIADAVAGGEIDLDGYATTSALDALTALVNGNTAEINALKSAGYQTSTDVQGAITTAIADMATDQELANLKTTLEAAIEDKQAKGEYLVAADLTELNDAIAELQSGKANASTVETIQTTINNLGNTYATKSDMTAADTALQNAIDAIEIPSLADYAKTADVEAALAGKESVSNKVSSATADEIEAMGSTEKQSKYPSIAVAQTIADAAVTKVNEVAGDLSSLQTQVSTNTADIKTINEAGYQTSTQVSQAIDTATATLATKDELNAKQDTLTAGAGITITDNTISASVDTSSFVPNPTATPTTYGEYVLMLSIGEDGKPEGYDWLDTLDLMGDSGFDM